MISDIIENMRVIEEGLYETAAERKIDIIRLGTHGTNGSKEDEILVRAVMSMVGAAILRRELEADLNKTESVNTK